MSSFPDSSTCFGSSLDASSGFSSSPSVKPLPFFRGFAEVKIFFRFRKTASFELSSSSFPPSSCTSFSAIFSCFAISSSSVGTSFSTFSASSTLSACSAAKASRSFFCFCKVSNTSFTRSSLSTSTCLSSSSSLFGFFSLVFSSSS